MKNLISFFFTVCFVGCFYTVQAQDIASASMDVPANYKKRNPIYDYSEKQLNNTDTVPGFETASNKLMVTGIIYEKDRKTPAKDVILYICQPDEDGDFVMKRDSNRKRYVHHRAWIKTDADGRYTFYTFMPGKFLRTKELKQINRVIKVPGNPEYDMNPFFFDDDPLIADLTLACRSEVVKSMLRLEKKGAMQVATRDIYLSESRPDFK
ncbi:hypothetical protein [Snuella lapsa]